MYFCNNSGYGKSFQNNKMFISFRGKVLLGFTVPSMHFRVKACFKNCEWKETEGERQSRGLGFKKKK